MSTQMFVQMCVTGIIMGLIYILMALGITLIFGVMRVVNFVHGEMMMLAAFGMYYAFVVAGLNFIVSLLLCLVGISIMGVLFQRYIYKPLNYDILNCMIIAAGAGIALKSAGWIVFGPAPRDVPTIFPGILNIFGTRVSMERLVVAIICVALMIGLYLFLRFTKQGKALRAVEQDSEAASVLGIQIDRVNAMAFIVGCSLAAVAGALVSMLYCVEPEMGAEPLIKSFMIILIGGMGSIPGAIIAGLLLGFIDSFAETLLGGEMAFVIGFALLMLILVVRPKGFFGYEEA